MNTDEYINLFDELDSDEQTENFINKDKRRQRFPERHFKYVREENAPFLKGQDDSSRSFNFTYSAARFEFPRAEASRRKQDSQAGRT